MPTATAQQTETTPELISKVNHWHGEVIGSMRTAIIAAKHAGDVLHKLKRREGKHNEWMPWLARNFTQSYESLNRYMRISKHWEKLKYKVADNHKLTLEEAIDMIVVKRKSKPEPQPADLQRETIRQTFNNHFAEWTDDVIEWLSEGPLGRLNRIDECLSKLLAERRANS